MNGSLTLIAFANPPGTPIRVRNARELNRHLDDERLATLRRLFDEDPSATRVVLPALGSRVAVEVPRVLFDVLRLDGRRLPPIGLAQP